MQNSLHPHVMNELRTADLYLAAQRSEQPVVSEDGEGPGAPSLLVRFARRARSRRRLALRIAVQH